MKNKIKKGLIISSCFLMCLTAVGCSKDGKDAGKDSSKKILEVNDARNAKIINQQEAILQFTTVNKAGSVISVELIPVNDTYNYILDAVDKKGNEFIYTIEGKTGNILKKEEKGPINKAKQTEYIDFVPVIDVDKAGKAAIEIANKPELNEVSAYKLYAQGGKNIYLVTLTNGGKGEDAKVEKVLIDAFTGKKLTEEEIKNAEEMKKAEDAKKAEEAKNAKTESSNTDSANGTNNNNNNSNNQQ